LLVTVWCWRRGGFEAYKHSTNDKFSWKNTLSQTIKSHEAKTVLSILTQYFRNGKALIKKEERKIQYNKDSTQNDTSFLLTAYNYNDFDSLNSYFLINPKTNDTLEKWNISYDSKSYRKIEEVRYAFAERFKDSTIYRYDEKGRLIEKSSLGFSFTSLEPLTQSKVEYIFKKDQLVIIKDFYKSIAGSWEHVDYYNNGLLRKTINYIDGKV
jgi:hypothetical protein